MQLGESYNVSRARWSWTTTTEAHALDRVLSGIFLRDEPPDLPGMIRFQTTSGGAVFDRVLQYSRWELPQPDMEAYLSRAFDLVVDYLVRRRDSIAARLDPTGDFNLQLAKKVRRLAIREGALRRPELLRELADDFFPLPSFGLNYWERSATTLAPPAG